MELVLKNKLYTDVFREIDLFTKIYVCYIFKRHRKFKVKHLECIKAKLLCNTNIYEYEDELTCYNFLVALKKNHEECIKFYYTRKIFDNVNIIYFSGKNEIIPKHSQFLKKYCDIDDEWDFQSHIKRTYFKYKFECVSHFINHKGVATFYVSFEMRVLHEKYKGLQYVHALEYFPHEHEWRIHKPDIPPPGYYYDF